MADRAAYDSPYVRDYISFQFNRLYQIALQNRKWIIIIIFPYEYQLRESTSKDKDVLMPQKILTDIAKSQHISAFDLPVFKHNIASSGKKSSYLYLFNDPMHLSNAGHQMTADIICSLLRKEGLAD